MSNIVRARVLVQGSRALVQHRFGPDAIPLEKEERSGVAGNNPEEWKKTCMVTEDGNLYIPGNYVFGCLKNGAVHTKKGRGSLQNQLVSTLQVEEDVVLLNRKMPEKLTQQYVLSPTDSSILVFVYITSVRNPSTKGRNIRYRLSTRSGWKARFTLRWDKTIISREQMKAILRDSGTLGGLGDGIRVGCGRFDVISYQELEDAQETPTEGSVGQDQGNSLEKRQRKVLPL